MNHNRTFNNRINSLPEGALRLVYSNFNSLFHQFLDRNTSVAIHQRNLQTLTIEIFRLHKNIAQEIAKDEFEIKNLQFNF